MSLKITTTEDGSNTIYSEQYQDHYHSTNGAIQEAHHIFIENGLKQVEGKFINVLEVGFGTGLNALCTFNYANQNNIKVNYIGIEPHKLDLETIKSLNYSDFFKDDNIKYSFHQMHILPFDYPHYISDNFILNVINAPLQEVHLQTSIFDIVYFDPFKPSTHQDLWTKDIFVKIFHSLNVNGILMTYSTNSEVRKALVEAGFCVDKIPGPAGKREITRATKIIHIAECKKDCGSCSHHH